MSEQRARRNAGPHLTSLTGDAGERVTAMEWARYLGGAFGSNGALEALRYYESIGWISEDVRRTMVDYVRGLSLEDLAPDAEFDADLDDDLAGLEGSPFERHAASLEFIAAIADDNLGHDLASVRSMGDGTPSAVSGPGADLPSPPAPSDGEHEGDAGESDEADVSSADAETEDED